MLRFVLIFLVFHVSSGSSYIAVLSGDRQAVLGATLQFRVEVFDEYGNPATGEFRFTWMDNAIPRHNITHDVKTHVDTWNMTYDPDTYLPGPYNLQVDVEKYYFVFWKGIASARLDFDISLLLNGDLSVVQKNQTRRRFVSNNETVAHRISLTEPDQQFLNATYENVLTYWMVDCVYNGVSRGLELMYNYPIVDKTYYVEAFVIASNGTFEPPANATNATETNEVSTRVPVTESRFVTWLRGFELANRTVQNKFCFNSSIIPYVENETYGYFRTNLTSKAPIKISPMNGTNWLMDGNVLNITLSCNGSYPFRYCLLMKSGLYNVTGNETCAEERTIKNCSIGIQHFFKEPSEYTFVVIITNYVSHVVKPIAITVYKVTKHAQLSVIVVPVSFSFLAIVLIVFGVAYYLQSRRTYTIEVADFDFGHQTNGMEYKTFQERLRESVTNSFFKSQDLNDSENVWSPSRKYGSMQ